MIIRIPEMGIVKEQDLDIKSDVSIIYGYNNSGKTTVLKALNETLWNRLLQAFMKEEKSEIPLYIPTNRLIVSDANTERVRVSDFEELIQYQKDALDNFALHLRNIRNALLSNETIKQFLCDAIKNIFDIEITNITHRYSDGVENVINIYMNIIWTMTCRLSAEDLTQKQFCSLISSECLYVFIDEVEMFLHVNSQSRLIDNLREAFPKCVFVMTTHSPLILTRCKNAAVYNIQDGMLELVQDKLYYRDLDNVYEELFFVEELPRQLQSDIDYLGKIIMKEEEPDGNKINQISRKLEMEYYNLFLKYNVILTKAQYMVKDNDKN